MKVFFAKRCAWRAVYLYSNPRSVLETCGRQLFVLGLDPTADGGPRVFIGFFGRVWHRYVPHVRWGMAARWRILMPVYRVQQRLLHRIDGRRRS